MKIYLAPMEGITGEVYRRAYHTFFEPMDKYFTPFLNPNGVNQLVQDAIRNQQSQ